MANTREIRDRMKSIRDTMKITNAMYMISSAKLRKAKKELEDTEPYFYTMQNMLARIARHLPDIEHPYIAGKAAPGGSGRCFLVVTADKGLAGSYNHNVLTLAEEKLSESSREPGTDFLLVVGEVGRQYFHTKKIPVDEHFLYTAQDPTMHRARIIASKVLELYETGKADEVHIIYTSMKNALQTETNMAQLLPIKRQDLPIGDAPLTTYQEEFYYKPSAKDVIDSVVPNYITGYIFGALMESYCSEHNARMVAMQAANDSAKEMIQALSIEYNRARQSAITQEITEVISGAKAQKRKRRIVWQKER